MDEFERKTGIKADDHALIAKHMMFSGLEEETLHTLLGDSSVRNYPRNTSLFMQDESATRFYLVLEGWVKLYRQSVDGHESVIHVVAPGESFAEAAIFDTLIFPVNATVVEEARLLYIPSKSFVKRLRENSDICLNILAALSRRQRQLVQHVEQLTVSSSAERLALFLARLARQKEGPVKLRLPLDKSLIAARLGMQPETLSRSFAKLRDMGVHSKSSDIVIDDIAKLIKFSERE